MRNSALFDCLRLFADRAAGRLSADLEAGAEIPYEVAENPGAHSVLYRYQPLSAQFVHQRFAELRSLEGFAELVSALMRVEGTSGFLRAMGASYTPADERDRAESVLKELLALIWNEVTEFELDERRLERAYRQFESIVYEDTVVNTVVAPMLGVRLACERWDIGSGLTFVRGDLVDAPAEAVWATGRDDGQPNTLIRLTVESTPSDPPPLTAARLDFRRLLTALRLFKPGPANLGASAWWRTDEGPWQCIPLGFAGRSRGGEYWLDVGERDEFCELFELIRSGSTQGGVLPWALARFELGLEQPVAIDGLSDHLLALRALLDGGEPTPMAIAQRLAALCAEGERRAALQSQIEKAFRLERLVMRGDVDSIYLEAVKADSPDRLARDLEYSLRALLRDVACGHIEADVRRLADRMLGFDLPPDEASLEPAPKPAAEPKTEPALAGWDEIDTAPVMNTEPPVEPEFVARRARITERSRPIEEPTDPPTEETAPVRVRELRGEEDVDDWGFGDDPADYSAAV